jgi:hypothetical protein
MSGVCIQHNANMHELQAMRELHKYAFFRI